MSIFVRKADPRELDALVLRDELSATLAMLTGDSMQFRHTDEDFLASRMLRTCERLRWSSSRTEKATIPLVLVPRVRFRKDTYLFG